MNTESLTLRSDYEAARAIGPWLTEWLTSQQAPQLERVGELELAIHELAMNIVDHAYDESNRDDSVYTITLRHDRPNVVAEFADQGRPFEGPATTHDDHEPHVRGYGLMIVEQLANSIDYSRTGAENRWTLVFTP